jgi:nucleoside-diphosphate-sugar epimerase
MRVFVVGATGWIGGAILDKFKEAKYTVTGLARSDNAAQRLHSRGAEPIRGDLTDPAALCAPAQEADATIYAAAAPPDATRVALDALLTTLDGSDKPLVYISGSSVYGDTGNDGPADEDVPLHPPSSVAWLLAHEQIVRNAAERGVRGIVIRGAGILYGHGGGATPEFWLNDARQHNVARYIGTGLQRWSAVHVDDLASLVVQAVERAPAGSVFNAAAEAIPLCEAAQTVAQATGVTGGALSVSEADIREEWGEFFANLLAHNLWLKSARAERLLNWHPTAGRFKDDLLHGSYQ